MSERIPHESNQDNDLLEKHPSRQQRDGKIPKTIWQIGIMMLLVNMSFVMAYSFSGLYLKKILGASAMGIGAIEGVCETVSHVMKLVSGMLSDFFRKRKGLIIFGYVFSVLSRPILAISDSFALVFSAKTMERFGNGVQASPRDAIIADLAPRKRIGASYGLKRSLAYIGSFLGGIFGILAMKGTGGDYQAVFAIASIPAFIAFMILLFFVKEPDRFDHPAITSEAPMPSPKLKPKFTIKNFKYMGFSFWMLMIINAVFMMSRMSETFIILRMNDGFEPNIMLAPLVMVVFNFGTALSCYPVGLLGDKLNRGKILFLGIILLILADTVMYMSATKTAMYIGVFIWGAQCGITQNVFVSMVAEKVPEELRGTGIGIYWLVNAFSAFIADTLAGYVWHHFSMSHIFVSSGIIGVIALILLSMLIRYISPSSAKIRRSS